MGMMRSIMSIRSFSQCLEAWSPASVARHCIASETHPWRHCASCTQPLKVFLHVSSPSAASPLQGLEPSLCGSLSTEGPSAGCFGASQGSYRLYRAAGGAGGAAGDERTILGQQQAPPETAMDWKRRVNQVGGVGRSQSAATQRLGVPWVLPPAAAALPSPRRLALNLPPSPCPPSRSFSRWWSMTCPRHTSTTPRRAR